MTLPRPDRWARARITKWWKASDWSRMTGQDIAWHAAGWALCLVCVLVVGVAYACAVAMWPRPMCVLTFAAILAGSWAWVGYWFGTRSISVVHDRLDYAKQHHDAVTNSPARELLAEVGPIAGPTPITDVEPEPWVLGPAVRRQRGVGMNGFPDVRPGDVWKDNDPRGGPTFVVVQVCPSPLGSGCRTVVEGQERPRDAA